MSSVVRVHPPPQKNSLFLHINQKKLYFCNAKRNGLVAQLDRVPDYGSGGCGFDSRLVHTKKPANAGFFILSPLRLQPSRVVSPESEQEYGLSNCRHVILFPLSCRISACFRAPGPPSQDSRRPMCRNLRR